MTRRPASFRDDTRGTATIELGLFAPILAAMLIGLIDLSTAYSDKLFLEQVAQRMVERIQQTGFSPSMEAALETEAAAAAGEGAAADATYWLECDGVKAASFTSGCSNGQVVERYVQLDISKAYTPIIPAAFTGTDANGVMTLHGIAGIRFQ